MSFLIIGANLEIIEKLEFNFTIRDYIAHFILKGAILPFVGVLFSLIASSYYQQNRALLFTAFIQWILPTSLHIVAITQSKEINMRGVCIVVAIQWLMLVLLSNYIFIPPFLKAINSI